MIIQVGDVVKTRKSHPCGSDTWTLTRVGADVKMKCQKCGHVVMLDRQAFEKSCKKLISHGENTDVQ
ncbi:MAG: DUF951 domain-containing protein [Clostridia bacterium]|nr:DUF951 domain-containing protein [Clostridia bacterium]